MNRSEETQILIEIRVHLERQRFGTNDLKRKNEMHANKDMDPMQLCRICAVNVADDDASSYLLIKNNVVTELGEKFISCLGIQVRTIVILMNIIAF